MSDTLHNVFPELIIDKEHIFTTNTKCPINEYTRTDFKQRYSVITSYEELQQYLPENDQIIHDTGRYILDYHKKGLYVSFKDGKLKYFLFLNKTDFSAPYQNKIKINPHLNIAKDSKYRLTQCLLRIISEKTEKKNVDFYIMELLYFFKNLASNRSVPDCNFYFNYKDQVLIHKIGSTYYTPFVEVFGKVPLEDDWQDSKLGRLFSFSSIKNYDDIPFVTPDDIVRVFQIFTSDPKSNDVSKCVNHYYHKKMDVKWEDKLEIAYFRGTSTGCGNDIYSNQRIKLAFLDKKWFQDSNSSTNTSTSTRILDAKITRWAFRLKKTEKDTMFNRINIKKMKELGIELAEKVPIEELFKYKYILNVDGNVAAYRLGFLLSLNCVVLIVEGKYKLWFQDQLVENKHYVSVKSDLSNLKEKIYWCKNHDKECKEIAKNAIELHNKIFTKDNLYDYTINIIENMNKKYYSPILK